ncbi:unnamed protein product [Paramecium primaurelia]|uniref:1-phosphatidylinositol 4-kinase n=1 Tax=Paramecium primaurelia TaxID=5886 RepID=A0A8S1JSB8_PARPR|nr:unnamed protein product [Paramecium primaurelia]
MQQEEGVNCFCFQKKNKGVLPKTFKKTNEILRKYKNNFLDISDSDILEVIIRLYVSEDKQKAISMLSRCRINPNFQSNNLREDLEYFIPQMVNFMVFHQQLSDENLKQFVLKASSLDFFFAHLVYFQMKSLSQIITPHETVTINVVKKFLEYFLFSMAQNYSGNLLIATHILQMNLELSNLKGDNSDSDENSPKKSQLQAVYQGTTKQQSMKVNEAIQNYGTADWIKYQNSHPYDNRVKNHKEIELQDYESIFNLEKNEKTLDTAFISNILFWNDIMRICDELSKVQTKKTEVLQACLQKMNKNLPASVYVPFVNNQVRNYAILKIVPKESRVFSTKMRSPFSLTLELYRPEIEGQSNHKFIEKKISRPITMSQYNLLQRTQSQLFNEDHSIIENRRTFSSTDAQKQIQNDFQQIKFFQMNPQVHHPVIQGTSQFYHQHPTDENEEEQIDQQKLKPEISSTYSLEENVQAFSIDEESSITQEKNGEGNWFTSIIGKNSFIQPNRGLVLTTQEHLEMKQAIFGENSLDQFERIKSQSIFSQLQTWNIIHLIIKTGDNLKQEQFALQLISQFDQIFKKEGLPLKLRYYEVLSMGPDCGIIEMIKNATTIDSLQKHLRKDYTQFKNFSDFFRSFFRHKIDQALENYVQSLVAYGLVCYFLQVKDRHNGNILLDSEGHLIHIDFGFFLSIAPGKGVEFEKNVPFKLLSDYIEVLGGVQGNLFKENFRKLFFQGFKACQKHQKEILLLAEMMYTGHGTTLPCFSKGEQTLKELQLRFNPKVQSSAELYVHVQELIDKSLDNWRARWYDKFQYFAQGIFY